jgi:general secretion pathway protein I
MISTMRGAQRGFSLLEVVVALAILGLALGVLLEIFGSGLNGAELTSRYAQAATIAESRLASVGADVPLQPGDTGGSENDAFRWTLSIKPYDEQQAQPQMGAPQSLMRVQLFEIVARVSWSDYGKEREVVLSTLQLGPKL